MKEILKFKNLLFLSIFILLSSCGGPPSLCDCLTKRGDLPSGCKQVFIDNYDTTDPILDQMRDDYYIFRPEVKLKIQKLQERRSGKIEN